MRIISGKYRSLNIKMVGSQETRETSDKVRGAVFNSLASHIPGSTVLDLFAGSGSYGLEALSRGAVSCCFVDRQRQAMLTIEENIKHIKISENVRVLQKDYQLAVDAFINSGETFDVIILDPPYDFNAYEILIEKLSNLLTEDSVIVCETHKQTKLLIDDESKVKLYKESTYGIKKIHYMRLK